jgi:hypothetical protein
LAFQSGLEKTLDKAIEEGDLEKAVKISDQLAGREFAIKIATAFDCLEYLEHQKVCEYFDWIISLDKESSSGETQQC